jgi:membrane protein implicated in regulation of membrane protease activity
MTLLDGISPWWWVALAILLAAAEMVTITTVLVWAAAAALITAILLWISPGLGGYEQVGIFAGLSIVFFFVGRALVARFGQPGDSREAAGLNRRAQALVGREGVVTAFERGEGKVTIDGVPWPARVAEGAPAPAPGEIVRVTAADGIVVTVRPAPPA